MPAGTQLAVRWSSWISIKLLWETNRATLLVYTNIASLTFYVSH